MRTSIAFFGVLMLTGLSGCATDASVSIDTPAQTVDEAQAEPSVAQAEPAAPFEVPESQPEPVPFVPPEHANPAGQARTIAADLAVMRNAIDLYAIEHDGKYPGLARIQQQLTQYTDEHGVDAGARKDRFMYGPYIRSIPDNKITDLNGFSPMHAPDPTTGWAYDEDTGELLLLISDPEAYTAVPAEMRGTDVLLYVPEPVEAE